MQSLIFILSVMFIGIIYIIYIKIATRTYKVLEQLKVSTQTWTIRVEVKKVKQTAAISYLSGYMGIFEAVGDISRLDVHLTNSFALKVFRKTLELSEISKASLEHLYNGCDMEETDTNSEEVQSVAPAQGADMKIRNKKLENDNAEPTNCRGVPKDYKDHY